MHFKHRLCWKEPCAHRLHTDVLTYDPRVEAHTLPSPTGRTFFCFFSLFKQRKHPNSSSEVSVEKQSRANASCARVCWWMIPRREGRVCLPVLCESLYAFSSLEMLSDWWEKSALLPEWLGWLKLGLAVPVQACVCVGLLDWYRFLEIII